MIPSQKLELNLELWKEEYREGVQKVLGEYYFLNGNEHIICYPRNANCHINSYKGYENCNALIYDYGYASTEASIEKYVQQFINDPHNEYFIEIGLIPKDYEKYYKHGTYIDENGIDTGEDFYDIYKDGIEPETQYKNSWVTVTIFKIKRVCKKN